MHLFHIWVYLPLLEIRTCCGLRATVKKRSSNLFSWFSSWYFQEFTPITWEAIPSFQAGKSFSVDCAKLRSLPPLQTSLIESSKTYYENPLRNPAAFCEYLILFLETRSCQYSEDHATKIYNYIWLYLQSYAGKWWITTHRKRKENDGDMSHTSPITPRLAASGVIEAKCCLCFLSIPIHSVTEFLYLNHILREYKHNMYHSYSLIRMYAPYRSCNFHDSSFGNSHPLARLSTVPPSANYLEIRMKRFVSLACLAHQYHFFTKKRAKKWFV